MSHSDHLSGSQQSILQNQMNRSQLQEKLQQEAFSRCTVSFYRYVKIEDPALFRDQLFGELSKMSILGRVYIAHEGVNAQVSYPAPYHDRFVALIRSYFPRIEFKEALEESQSFLKLVIKVKSKIVADGLDDATFDSSDVGRHLNAEEFHAEMSKEDTVVVDVRNAYESEIGHFLGALRPNSVSFREELPMIRDMLKGKENQKILLYCTGGIRCEKASAWLRHEGFKDVNQLSGGIIQYAREVKSKGLESRFRGKNFVFDSRMAEAVTNDVIANCHQCGQPADSHTNCLWDPCHLLFIQCSSCAKAYDGCCSSDCQEKQALCPEERLNLRRKESESSTGLFRSRRIADHLRKQ